MDENLRAALIQFLNSKGEAPDPASQVDIDTHTDGVGLAFRNPRNEWDWLVLYDVTLQDLLQFLLEYRVV